MSTSEPTHMGPSRVQTQDLRWILDHIANLTPPGCCVPAGCQGDQGERGVWVLAYPGEAQQLLSSPASLPSFFSVFRDWGSWWEVVGVV